jgi:ClpP class serine protease
MLCLLRREVALELVRARQANHQFSATQITDFGNLYAAANGMPRNLQVIGDLAEIRVEGVLTPKPDLWAYYFGGGNTTYEQIQQAFALAQGDPAIKRISVLVNSPGGYVAGLFDTLGAIQAVTKPVAVRAAYACSAAYAIAAVAGKIEATNPAVELGSVGVATTYFVDETEIDITNTESPDKRPDPTTPEGQAVIRKELDALYDLFVDAIAAGRGTTAKAVIADFGRGAVLLAGEAKRRGMIDRIAKPALRAVNADPELTDNAPEPGGKADVQMDIETLKKDHPALYEAACAVGRDAERKRVLAHLKLGKNSGAMEVAENAIASGASTMDEDVHASYMSAAMNRADQTARQTDSNTAGKAVGGAATETAAPAKDLGDQIVDRLEAARGTTKKSA